MSDFKENFNFYINILVVLILVFQAVVWADTNGIWHKSEDIRSGIFGADEDDSDFYFNNLNVVDTLKSDEVNAKLIDATLVDTSTFTSDSISNTGDVRTNDASVNVLYVGDSITFLSNVAFEPTSSSHYPTGKCLADETIKWGPLSSQCFAKTLVANVGEKIKLYNSNNDMTGWIKITCQSNNQWSIPEGNTGYGYSQVCHTLKNCQGGNTISWDGSGGKICESVILPNQIFNSYPVSSNSVKIYDVSGYSVGSAIATCKNGSWELSSKICN